jgi:hypothetical protein
VSVRKRIEKYRNSGGAADLVKVEVLVPPAARGEVLRLAAKLRAEHRDSRELRKLCDRALSLYGPRVLDNVDLNRVPDQRARAGVIARALMERGDARAFVLGQQILARASEPMSLAEALAQPGDAADFDFDPPRLELKLKPVL